MTAVSAAIQAVIDLFAEPLRELRFADVDAATLDEFAASAQAAAAVVTTAETELARARHTLQERQDALLQHAQRALAYARVYAEADPALSEQLDQIALPRLPKRPRVDGDVLVLEPAPALRTRRGAPETGEPKRRGIRSREAKQDESVTEMDLPSTG
jgi:ElaB/YqjD/DUF883 family membrane-anchored ribosome-binding protein